MRLKNFRLLYALIGISCLFLLFGSCNRGAFDVVSKGEPLTIAAAKQYYTQLKKSRVMRFMLLGKAVRCKPKVA